MADDRDLPGDEAQRALSEAMRRTRATVPNPTPAELIAFVQDEYDDAKFLPDIVDSRHRQRLFSALLTGLERQQTDERSGRGETRDLLWQAFEAGHFAWPSNDAPTRRALFEQWLSSAPVPLPDAAPSPWREMANDPPLAEMKNGTMILVCEPKNQQRRLVVYHLSWDMWLSVPGRIQVRPTHWQLVADPPGASSASPAATEGSGE